MHHYFYFVINCSDLLHAKRMLDMIDYTIYLQEKENQKFNEGIPRHVVKLYLYDRMICTHIGKACVTGTS